jgi:hypothetical protein
VKSPQQDAADALCDRLANYTPARKMPKSREDPQVRKVQASLRSKRPKETGRVLSQKLTGTMRSPQTSDED